MPRRRLSSGGRVCIGSVLSNSDGGWKVSKRRAGGLHLVSNGDSGTRTGGQINIHTRAKAYKSITLAGIKLVTGLGVAKNALCDQARNLNCCHDMAVRRAYD